MEVHDTVQEVVTKITPKKKKYKGKVLVWEALKITEKRRKVKGKGEKERYTQLNKELQRITVRDSKTLLGEECKKKKKRGKQ